MRCLNHVSRIDGTTKQMTVGTPPESDLSPGEINPIPPMAEMSFKADFGGIPERDFLERWNTFSVVIKYDGKTTQRQYDKKWIVDQISQNYTTALPHISKRNP
jgi:hypothetical protein